MENGNNHLLPDVGAESPSEGSKPLVISETERLHMMARAIQKSAQPFLVGRPNGEIVLFNSAFSQLTGYSPEELYKMTWSYDLTPAEWMETTQNALNAIREIKAPMIYEKEYLKKGGSRLPVEVFIHPYFDEGEELIYCYAFITDISGRKAVENSIRRSEDKFSKIFHFNPDPISISTLEGVYLEVNDAWLMYTGYSREEVIGRSVADLNIWVIPEQREEIFGHLRWHGSVKNVEVEFRGKWGQVRTSLISMEILDVDGQPCVISMVKDITERKNMEEALRDSEERFSKAFNASPVTMSISRLDNGEIIDVNESFCRVIGFRREEILGRSSLDVGIWPIPAERERIRNMVENDGSVRDMEITFGTKEGELRLGLFSGERLMIGGIPCLISILTDITDKRRMENEMTRLDRLNLVGKMAAIIGHEIRNPMTTVRGFLQMLKGQPKFVQEAEVLNLMIEELDRANSIITEFLSLTRNKIVQLEMKNLNSIVSNMFPLLQAHAMEQDKNIEVRLQKVPDSFLDEKEIRQLILNMVRNGLDAMTNGGTLTIRTYSRGDKLVLSIQDQGHGMNMEVMQKLGTPFFTTKANGTGLGMAVCNGIAERHGASISVDTGPSGTRFDIYFPVNHAK